MVGSVLERTFDSTHFAREVAGVDLQALVRLSRELLEERPHTRAELGPLLAERWPDRPPGSLAQAATYLSPVVQVTPRGIWQRSGPSAWTTVESWLGRPLAQPQPPDNLILRYLAAFGPAAPKDIRVWSGLSGLAEVVARLRPQLLTFRDENGLEVVDLPEAPRPDPEIPVPPRFLPEYDNLLLAHSDRSRFFDSQVVPQGWVGNLLVDGIFSGSWRIKRTKQQTRLEIEPGKTLPIADRQEVEAEGDHLLAFTDPDVVDRQVIFVGPG